MLEKVDLDKSLSKEAYKRRLPALQDRLYDLQRRMFTAGVPVIIVFEGWAEAGKGDAIRTISKRLDPRGFRVVPVTAPRGFEKNYPWLWRHWLKIPGRGQIVIFDKSWYRRVLVDRFEKYVKKEEWQAAYNDIKEFEEVLAADGALFIKFWFHISKKEQARRFKDFQKSKLTAWQVTGEDLDQHKSYDKYAKIVEEMFEKTGFPQAPWTIVEANDPHFARVKVFKTIINAFEKKLSKIKR